MTDAKPIAQCKLDDYQRKTDAATEGPWHALLDSDGLTGVHSDSQSCKIYHSHFDPNCLKETWDRQKADAEFCAMARTAMPLLQAEVDRLKQFEPPVCEDCGEYMEDSSIGTFDAPAFKCGEC